MYMGLHRVQQTRTMLVGVQFSLGFRIFKIGLQKLRGSCRLEWDSPIEKKQGSFYQNNKTIKLKCFNTNLNASPV